MGPSSWAFSCRQELRDGCLPLMIPIELISQLARPISLAVRLFANMTAGHVILGVLFGLAISGGLLIGWLPFAFTIAMNGLEVGIAFIQAYIFTVLTCVYLGDAFHLHGHDEHAHYRVSVQTREE